MMPQLLMTILSLISSARGGNPAGVSQVSQLGSGLDSLIGSFSKARGGTPNLSDRGYPSSRFGY